MLKELLYFRKS